MRTLVNENNSNTIFKYHIVPIHTLDKKLEFVRKWKYHAKCYKFNNQSKGFTKFSEQKIFGADKVNLTIMNFDMPLK